MSPQTVAVQAPGVVEDDDAARRHVVDVVAHVAALDQPSRPVAQRERPPAQAERRVERCDAQALADDAQPIERVRNRGGRQRLQALDDGVGAHARCPNMAS